MSTHLEHAGDFYRISTMISQGKRKKAPRGTVRVLKSDKEAVLAELVRQAELARTELGVDTQ